MCHPFNIRLLLTIRQCLGQKKQRAVQYMLTSYSTGNKSEGADLDIRTSSILTHSTNRCKTPIETQPWGVVVSQRKQWSVCEVRYLSQFWADLPSIRVYPGTMRQRPSSSSGCLPRARCSFSHYHTQVTHLADHILSPIRSRDELYNFLPIYYHLSAELDAGSA